MLPSRPVWAHSRVVERHSSASPIFSFHTRLSIGSAIATWRNTLGPTTQPFFIMPATCYKSQVTRDSAIQTQGFAFA